MYLWAGLVLIAAGFACLAIDRQAVHFIYDHVSARQHRLLDSFTHLAKAAHWLVAAILIYGAARLVRLLFLPHDPRVFVAQDAATAFIASLALGSLVLHIMKRFVGRRRPRDEIEMHLYEFKFWTFKADYNSLPSGHALTIFSVAAIATCVTPNLAVLWFSVAAILSATRVLLTAHFVSDVLIGAGMGLISTHIVLAHFFVRLAPHWV
jgi:membrane-associated phospholipid phosphatase